MIPGSWPYTPETYHAFAAIKNSGFTLYCCGNRHAPHALVATYKWDHYIDIINIRALNQVTAARLPTHETPDIFAPARAVWQPRCVHGARPRLCMDSQRWTATDEWQTESSCRHSTGRQGCGSTFGKPQPGPS